MDIPQQITNIIAKGDGILFLGAGASVGAIHPKNEKIPDSSRLAKLIALEFLGSEFEDRPLSQVAELAMSERDLFSVQEFVASIFIDFQPAAFHKIIPSFVWRTIFTTNYDLLIERSYDQCSDRKQDIVSFIKNTDKVEEKLKRVKNGLQYIKLHGCITNISDKEIPLILSTDQYIDHQTGRYLLFERFKYLANQFPIIYIGSTLGDLDIRSLIRNLGNNIDQRPRSYLVIPEVSPTEVRFWESKKITCIKQTFEQFLYQLDGSIAKPFRTVAILNSELEHPICHRFSIPGQVKMSNTLVTFLKRDSEYISSDYKTTIIDPKAFYKGYFADWTPIVNNLDVRRTITDNLLSEIFLVDEIDKQDKQEFYVIKGYAGSGKTVFIRRLAWEASVQFNKCCLALKSTMPDYDAIVELYRLCKERIHLIVDPVNEYIDSIQNILQKARQDKMPITIIGAERFNEWNITCDSLDAFVTRDYELKYLSEKEIEVLIKLLADHDSLGHLQSLSFTQQKEEFSKRAGRQLLVALHEATLGKPFTDIVFDEYNSISSIRAKSLYLTVCIMHRLGVDTRSGLIHRVHGIPFTEFQNHLFKPLQYIVYDSKDECQHRNRFPHFHRFSFPPPRP